MADGDLFEGVYVGRYAGGLILNTFGFAQVGTTAGVPQADLAGLMLGAPFTALRGTAVAGLVWEAIWVNAVHPSGAARYETSSGLPLPGLQGGDGLPPSDAALITWRTALAGRSYRGRSFLSAVPEALQVAGTLTSGGITQIQAFADAMVGAFITNATTNHFRLVVISRQINGAVRPNPIGTAVTAAVVRPLLKRQGRRSIGLGA